MVGYLSFEIFFKSGTLFKQKERILLAFFSSVFSELYFTYFSLSAGMLLNIFTFNSHTYSHYFILRISLSPVYYMVQYNTEKTE